MSEGRVLIIGGGIGGLALWHALNRVGISAVIAEKTPVLKPVGAGITLSAGAVALLKALGVDLSGVGRAVNRLDIARADGTPLSTTHMHRLNAQVGPSYALHRHELHEALLRGIPASALRLGAQVENVREMGDGVEVEFKPLSHERFDVVIGADGINSQIRKIRWPEVKPRYAGYTCWRMVANAAGPEEPVELWGRGQRLGVVPLTGGRVYVFAVANAPAGTTEPNAGIAAKLRERFGHFAWADEVFAAAKDSDIIHHDIDELLCGQWTSGRLGLLGDAAHASTPNLGFGATLAVEDAWVLAEELASKGLTAEALQAYQARRFDRAVTVQTRSRQVGHVAQWQNGIACALRDFIVKKTPPARSETMVLNVTFGEAAVRKLVAGSPSPQGA